MESLTALKNSVIGGDEDSAADLTQRAIDANLAPKTILDDGLIAAMTIVGEQFKNHEVFLPEVLLAARAMNAAMEKLKPLLLSQNVPTLGRVVIGSVQGDLHDIGKNLVGIMLKGAGFEIIDLGHDVTPANFVDTAESESAGVIGMSALLTTTMPAMKQVVDLVHDRDLDSRIKTIVGGAPVTAEFASEINADAYGFDAASAVDRVKELLDITQ